MAEVQTNFEIKIMKGPKLNEPKNVDEMHN
jgi:hypothetical protein